MSRSKCSSMAIRRFATDASRRFHTRGRSINASGMSMSSARTLTAVMPDFRPPIPSNGED